jgi:hypothetical protein
MEEWGREGDIGFRDGGIDRGDGLRRGGRRMGWCLIMRQGSLRQLIDGDAGQRMAACDFTPRPSGAKRWIRLKASHWRTNESEYPSCPEPAHLSAWQWCHGGSAIS